MKTSHLALSTCASVVMLTACGPSAGGQDVAGGPSVPPSATSVVPSPSPSPSPVAIAVPSQSAQPTAEGDECRQTASYEQSAQCLYSALAAGDQQTARQYAAPEAVNALFALPDVETWTFHGCDQLGEFDYRPARVCHFQIPYDVHPTYVQLAMSAEYVAEQVQTVG